MANGDILELACLGENLQEELHLLVEGGLTLEVLREQLDRLVLDVVVGGDPAEVGRLQVDVVLVLGLKALGPLQVLDGLLDQLAQEVVDVLACAPRQVVVVRVLRYPSVEESPRDPVDGVLLVLDRACHHLGRQMIVQAVVQLRLHRVRLLHKLDEVLFLRRVAV